MTEKKHPHVGGMTFTYAIDSLSDIYPVCNLSTHPGDPYCNIKSIPKRRMWIFLYRVGKGRFFTKAELAKQLGLTNAVAGRVLYGLKQDGIINYTYFTNKGFCLSFVMPIDFNNRQIAWGCPFGFRSETLDCENCLFCLNDCRIKEALLGGEK